MLNLGPFVNYLENRGPLTNWSRQ